MEDANNLKVDGNQAFRELRFDDALPKYEMAILSFRFLLNHNENIRTEVGSRTGEIIISNWASTLICCRYNFMNELKKKSFFLILLFISYIPK